MTLERFNRSMRHQELLIGGQFYGGPCDHEIGKLLSKSPWSGQNVGTSAEAGWPEVRAAVESAHDAFHEWRVSSLESRGVLLRRIRDLLEERKDELAELMALEIGKPVTLGLAEVARAKRVFDLTANWVEGERDFEINGGDDVRGTGITGKVVREPYGPFFCITPYNWPFLLAAHKIAPLLAVGGTGIVKGSPLSPLCSLALGRLVHEAGCPDGVLNFIQCEPILAEKAISDPRIKGISFTGSEKVGWHLQRTFPEKQVILELGGDAHCVLADDSDWEKAVKMVPASAFGYGGQVCISMQKLMIHDSIYAKAKGELVKLVQGLSCGDPKDPETLCGPMISLEEADRARSWIEEALSGGAKLLAGGLGEGRMIPPTLIEDIPSDCRLESEEAFAPILCLSSFETLDEAIERINASRFGLHSSLFTSSRSKAERFFREVQTQGVVINDVPSLRFDHLPYGGMKRSGKGREGIPWSAIEYTHLRTCTIRGSFARP